MSLDIYERERERLCFKPHFLLHEIVSSLVFPWQRLFWDHKSSIRTTCVMCGGSMMRYGSDFHLSSV